MTDHLAPAILNALADGELTPPQLAQANEHLATCPACTTTALHQSLLKSATARAGQRYAPPPHLQERLLRLAAHEHLYPQQQQPSATAKPRVAIPRLAILGWAAAAALLLFCAAALFIQRNLDHANIAAARHTALVSEVFDQHVATLANAIPPQVLSTDRHTVKPWFQGKIPFSFNLPDNLPSNTTLDGANLTYLRNQPVAQLLYSIGKHRVSIFLSQQSGTTTIPEQADRAGFHVIDRTTGNLEIVAISDVDPARLAELTTALQQAQTPNAPQSR